MDAYACRRRVQPMNAAWRRLKSVSALFAAAIVLTATIPSWLPLTALADALRGRRRLPTTRLLAFGVCWAWYEVCGVVAAAASVAGAAEQESERGLRGRALVGGTPDRRAAPHHRHRRARRRRGGAVARAGGDFVSPREPGRQPGERLGGHFGGG